MTDEGCIRINYHGTEAAEQNTVTLTVHDGKACTTPVLKVIGRTATLQVGGLLSLQSTGRGIDIQNTAYTKDNARLTNLITCATVPPRCSPPSASTPLTVSVLR